MQIPISAFNMQDGVTGIVVRTNTFYQTRKHVYIQVEGSMEHPLIKIILYSGSSKETTFSQGVLIGIYFFGSLRRLIKLIFLEFVQARFNPRMRRQIFLLCFSQTVEFSLDRLLNVF